MPGTVRNLHIVNNSWVFSPIDVNCSVVSVWRRRSRRWTRTASRYRCGRSRVTPTAATEAKGGRAWRTTEDGAADEPNDDLNACDSEPSRVFCRPHVPPPGARHQAVRATSIRTPRCICSTMNAARVPTVANTSPVNASSSITMSKWFSSASASSTTASESSSGSSPRSGVLASIVRGAVLDRRARAPARRARRRRCRPSAAERCVHGAGPFSGCGGAGLRRAPRREPGGPGSAGGLAE